MSTLLRRAAVCLALALAPAALRAETPLTFLVTSDSHYDAFENEDRNERNRATIDQMNAISGAQWPEELGGGAIGTPCAVLVLGDVIDDGDRMWEGANQGERQFASFLADFGLDGTDGRLKYPVLESWGNHDGPPAGRERFGFSFQAKLKERNARRLAKGLIAAVSENGLHYSWNWGGVHFAELGLYPGNEPHPAIRYSPQYHDPQQSLEFLEADLRANAVPGVTPVIICHHYDLQGSDWWHADDRKAYYDAIRPYNVIAVFHGHTATGVYQWKPEGAGRPLDVVNTGQTENGFFVVEIGGERIRLAYRMKAGIKTVQGADGKARREWDGVWGWRHHLARDVRAIASDGPAPQAEGRRRRDYNILPVPFSKVHVDDVLWTPRLETSLAVTIPYAFEQCEATDRIGNFEKAAGLLPGGHEGAYFNDSDVYKVMEGAAYSLQVRPDRMMRLYLDQLIRVMAKAQWEDGYLYTFFSLPARQPEKRWTNIGALHEQYCAGHMYEAAVAHREVTGDDTFLDMARKNADLICRVFNADNRTDPPGHQEIEIGLCRLYRATGDEKYLAQAKFFLDQRGRKGRRGPDGNGGLYGTYAQDHIPVVEQKEAVGHSVRAAYLYTGMADVAALTGAMEYIAAIDAIWEDVVTRKLYITGGIGAAGGHEGFGGAYELPNMTAYCETCASIANVLWNHRMFLMHGDGKYIDVLERTMYNAALSGISLEGDRFFYPNVLESVGQHARSPWFGCACCPSNVARFIPSVPGFAYACKDGDVYVNLFIGGTASIETGRNAVRLVQTTRYPWEGGVRIAVEPEKEAAFAVLIRIPGWARQEPVPSDLYSFADSVRDEVSLSVNGEKTNPEVRQGYARIERVWKQGDAIELALPMPVRRIVSRPEVTTNRGRIALQRGPLVYCLEGPDNDGRVLDLVIGEDAAPAAEFRPDLLGGVVAITGKARTVKRTLQGGLVPDAERTFTAIPYYAWSHRGRAHMTVWPAGVPEAARPKPADTLAAVSKTTASYVHVSLDAIKDQNTPESSADSSSLQLDFWSHKGTTEWLQFEWDAPRELSRVKVYWFDDTGRGECRVPASWRVLARNAAGEFAPVENRGPYEVAKDAFNTVEFEPVTTTALKIEIVLQKDWSGGVLEVVIESPGGVRASE